MHRAQGHRHTTPHAPRPRPTLHTPPSGNGLSLEGPLAATLGRGLTKPTGLSEVDISRNPIGDVAAAALCSALLPVV